MDELRRPGRSGSWMLEDKEPPGLVLADAKLERELEMHEHTLKLLRDRGLV